MIEFTSRDDYFLINSSQEDVLIGKDWSFGREQNFAVAATISGYDIYLSNGEEDKDIGELKFYRKVYEIDPSNSSFEFIELETRPCTYDDFNTNSGE